MLAVKNLSFSYGQRPILKSLSFSLSRGELIRVGGPNGAGKSTLLSLVAGLTSGSNGSITFGSEICSKADIAWLPPDANALNPSISAYDNLMFWLDLSRKKVAKAELNTTLEKWGLRGEYLTRHLTVGSFSTGMRRRLALARLELYAAKLWLVDEPLFGLDSTATDLFRKLLSTHLAKGGAALLVTHDERFLEHMIYKTVLLGDAP